MIKMTEASLSSLFVSETFQWGLRGDPLLWKEMKEKIKLLSNIKTATEFEICLNDLFLELTNSKPENKATIFVERYNLGGMSSGHVSTEFWLETGFPLLVSRFNELHGE